MRVAARPSGCYGSSVSLQEGLRMSVAEVTAPARRFVPKDLQLTDFGSVEPLYRELLSRQISSRTEMDKWLSDFSELTAVVDEVGSRRYIDKSCHTDDAE